MVTLLHSLDANAGKYSFLYKILKQSKPVVRNLSREVTPSGIKLLKKSDVRKIIPSIPLRRITPEIVSIATMGKKFADGGKFAKKFINTVPDPGEVLRQASKYGSGYVKTAERVSKSFIKHSDDLLFLSKKTMKKGDLPFSKKILPNFKKPKFVNEKLVEVLKRTGKKGYEVTAKITKWAAAHPNSSLSAIALAWYMTDPEGFSVALNKSGKTVAEFITTTVSSAAGGVGQGAIEGFTNILTSKRIPSVIVGVLIALLIFVRPVRRFALTPFKIIGQKMNETADKYEKKSSHSFKFNEVSVAKEEPSPKPSEFHRENNKSSSLRNKTGGSSVFD